MSRLGACPWGHELALGQGTVLALLESGIWEQIPAGDGISKRMRIFGSLAVNFPCG